MELSKRRRGWWRNLLVIAAGGLLVFTCAPAAIFPPKVLEKVDRTVTFEQVVNHPDEYQGRVVELGGQILGSMVKGEEVHVLVRVLPIQTKPVYGPVDRDRERGMFIIRYTGKVGEQDLQRGNMGDCHWASPGRRRHQFDWCPSQPLHGQRGMLPHLADARRTNRGLSVSEELFTVCAARSTNLLHQQTKHYSDHDMSAAMRFGCLQSPSPNSQFPHHQIESSQNGDRLRFCEWWLVK